MKAPSFNADSDSDDIVFETPSRDKLISRCKDAIEQLNAEIEEERALRWELEEESYRS